MNLSSGTVEVCCCCSKNSTRVTRLSSPACIALSAQLARYPHGLASWASNSPTRTHRQSPLKNRETSFGLRSSRVDSSMAERCASDLFVGHLASAPAAVLVRVAGHGRNNIARLPASALCIPRLILLWQRSASWVLSRIIYPARVISLRSTSSHRVESRQILTRCTQPMHDPLDSGFLGRR